MRPPRSGRSLSLQTTELHNLLAQGRISPRRASVFAFIDSMLLNTVREIGKQPPEIIFDIPRPQRTNPPSLPNEICPS
jgi:hypothetical protein